ncbi:MAG: hypothetical protein ACI9OJ_004958 [Myxococcota bacterium]|jgi:uncharacterized protein YdiU (UPF0061 family)
MFHLGVPTTRALSLVLTGDDVVRDMFYDGHPKPEPGAIVARVAPSFIRFGNFEVFASRGDVDTLRALVDHTLARHYPELGPPGVDSYVALVAEVARRTAIMVSEWMRVGFVHGVMNTDNMSVLGLTIDYGPYGWLENYDPDWTPNTTDAGQRRYRFGQQPAIAHWNLARFASAIHPLVGEAGPLEEAMETFISTFTEHVQATHANKLGFSEFRLDTDEALVSDLSNVLTLTEMDMTIFYRELAAVEPFEGQAELADRELLAPVLKAAYTPDALPDYFVERLATWTRRYLARSEQDPEPGGRRTRMMAANPKYVLRNYVAQLAIDDAEAGNYATISELLDVLRRPYDEQPGSERWAEKRPEWARDRAGCSMLSCSS